MRKPTGPIRHNARLGLTCPSWLKAKLEEDADRQVRRPGDESLGDRDLGRHEAVDHRRQVVVEPPTQAGEGDLQAGRQGPRVVRRREDAAGQADQYEGVERPAFEVLAVEEPCDELLSEPEPLSPVESCLFFFLLSPVVVASLDPVPLP